MRRYHLVVGLLALALFLGTGQYMDVFLGHLRNMADGPRLLYRTRHIFILLTALIHLVLATYVQRGGSGTARTVRWVGSALVTSATALFLAGFVYEPLRGDLRTPFSHWATYAIVAGVGLHVVAGFKSITAPERSTVARQPTPRQ